MYPPRIPAGCKSGAPSSSWAMYRARLEALFSGADPRVCIAFWLFGLINNVLYVVILSAALDLVGPSVPKGIVLIANISPSFVIKLFAPYFIHAIPYSIRILLLTALSSLGMLLIALTPAYDEGGTITTKLAGVVMASLSSGAGEMSFLGLTHFYGPFSLAAWGSGTGGAGLFGAGAYAAATNSLGLSVKQTLLTSSCLPFIMLAAFFVILPLGPMKTSPRGFDSQKYPKTFYDEQAGTDELDEGLNSGRREDEGLLRRISTTESFSQRPEDWSSAFIQNLRRTEKLFIPFMLPLLLVYVSEYTINQGVAPTLLFPLSSTPFAQYRSFYPTYNTIYQAGVFLSRSSLPLFRIHRLYPPSLLQCLNLVLLILHAMYPFLPNVWFVFAIFFWEGLLGGLVYVNAFAEIQDKTPRSDREFSLTVTSVSDSAGVCTAGFLSTALEVGLCTWQVNRGRDWCRRV